jgi:2Fe-2S ferredoxin
MTRNIQLTVIENGIKQSIQTFEGEYRNLMTLIRDQLAPENFGECGGMGRCATCIVKTEGITGTARLKDRNEPVTLTKAGYEDPDIRLSCQIYITKDLEGSEIELLDT